MNRLTAILFTLSLFSLTTTFAQKTRPGHLHPLEGTGIDQFTRVGLPRNMQNMDRAVLPSATFEVTYSGFTAQAQAAFQYAVDIWSYQVASDVPIKITANWTALGPSTLGSAGANTIHQNFANAPNSNTWYPAALANKLAGTDLSTANADITANFNSSFANWYFGTDGITPAGQYDFVTVVLHEIGHGLGFAGSGSESGGTGSYGNSGNPYIYDTFVENGSGTAITSFTNPSAALGTELISEDLHVDGTHVTGTHGGVVEIYAPNPFDAGSSYSHWDESTFPAGNANSLMTPQLGTAEAIHDPGDLCRSFFQDMGWVTKSNEANAPFNLNAFSVSADRIDLTWNETSNNEAGYIIERATTYAGTYSPIDTILPNLTSYNDLSLSANTDYFYQVRTLLNGGGSSSSPTPVDSASTLGCAPAIPGGHTWTATNQDNPFAWGTTSNANVTITYLGEGQYQVSDISGDFYSRLGGVWVANQPAVIEDSCGFYTIINSTGSQVNIIDDGGGTTNTSPTTLHIPWRDASNGFSDSTVFTINAGTADAAPTVSAYNLQTNNVQATSLQLNWTNGNGSNNLVLARAGDMVLPSSLPSDSASYSANAVFGSGTAMGNSYVVYDGTGTSVTVTGLTKSTNYYFSIISYNILGADNLYQTDNYGITAAQTDAALPAEWLSFTGTFIPRSGIRLDWEVSGADVSGTFDVEHSLDRNIFETIGAVPITTATIYEFTTPENQPGRHYFRLREVDTDGNFTYSPVVEVEVTSPLQTLSVSPNPVSSGDPIDISWSQGEPAMLTLLLTDNIGRIIREYHTRGEAGYQKTHFSTNRLAPGIYVLRATLENHPPMMQRVIIGK